MSRELTQAELEAYLDEALAPEEMAAVESELRRNKHLLSQLAAINARRDAGVHTVAEIWRRHHVSCLTREQLGRYLLQALDEAESQYIHCHIELVGCRFCRANLEDLSRQNQETTAAASTRRNRYFQSTAGHLPRK